MTMHRPATSTARCRYSERSSPSREPPRVLITGPDSVDAGKPAEAQRCADSEKRSRLTDAALQSSGSLLRVLTCPCSRPARRKPRLQLEGDVAAGRVRWFSKRFRKQTVQVIGESSPILIEARK